MIRGEEVTSCTDVPIIPPEPVANLKVKISPDGSFTIASWEVSISPGVTAQEITWTVNNEIGSTPTGPISIGATVDLCNCGSSEIA